VKSIVKPPVLIVYEEAEKLAEVLAGQFPDTDFQCVNTAEMLAEALQRHQPEIAFSIKGPGFPADGHRPLTCFPSLRWIQVGGSGYDHLLPWNNEALTLTNCAGVLAAHLAETVIGGMIALNLGLPEYLRLQAAHTWRPHSFRPLSEQTLLVVGLGKIGGIVATHAKALGMRVLAIRSSEKAHPSVDEMYAPDELATVVRMADFVSLHVRLNESTKGMFSREILGAMKRGAYLINTARGGVVDEAALIETLQRGYLAGAYLDVFEHEPLVPSSPLWDMQQVIITPHAADDVFAWPLTFTKFFANNLKKWFRGMPLENVVLR
jgi:phosphoglycerate dehydrogenase-like enzyme